MNEPPGGGDVQSENLGVGMRQIDLLGREEQPGIQVGDLDLRPPWLFGIQGQRKVGVAQFQGIEKWIAANQVREIDLQGHLVDHRQGPAPVFGVEDLDFLRHQPAQRVEGEMPEGHFHPALPEFFGHIVAPLAREPFLIGVPKRARRHGDDQREKSEKDTAHAGKVPRQAVRWQAPVRICD